MKDSHFRGFAMASTVATLMSMNVQAGPASAERPDVTRAGDGSADGAMLRARGLEHGYNLDHPQALAAFREAIAADPHDATAYRLAAASLWIRLLFDQGAVTVDDYLGQVRANVPRKAPPAEVATAFRDYIARALTIAETKRRQNPADADVHFQIGAAAGFHASYVATVEGRVLGGVGFARRAYREHKRCLELDPRRKDAGLIVGLYRYAVAALPVPMRLLAVLAGFGSGRERGLRLVEEAAQYPSDVQTNARFTLILLYNREGRHADALRVIRQLQERHPRNRLLWLEAGSTALRAGQPADALEALDEGLAKLSKDPRPRAYGEEARWRYYRGAALAALGDGEAAERELRAVLALDAHDWVHESARLELGKLKAGSR